MNKPHFTQEQLVQVAKLTDADIEQINLCRGEQSKIGFAYQICYVKLFNRFPPQSPLEILDELATFVAIQLDIPKEWLHVYALKQSTISEHQEQIRAYLLLNALTQNTEDLLCDYLFQQALQIQETESLFLKVTEFLKKRRILNPTDYTIERLIKSQREKARTYIFGKIAPNLTPALREALDNLLIVGTETYSKLYQIKEVPHKPSEKGMKLLSHKLTLIEQTGVLSLKLNWLNNNYKRYFSKYVTRCDAKRLRELEPLHRYTSLACFLQEAYQNTKDHIFDMYQKAINRVCDQADRKVDEYNKSKRNTTRSCLISHKNLCVDLLTVTDGTTDIGVMLNKYPQVQLQSQIEAVESLLAGKYSSTLNVIADRFSYLRQMARPLLEKLTLELEPTGNASLVTALQIEREIIQDTRRSVPGNINLDFLPKSVAQAVKAGGGVNRKLFEGALFTRLPDIVTHGDLAILGSKRYGKLENFFIDPKQWEAMREEFFRKNKLPQKPKDVPAYLENRLDTAIAFYLERENGNKFARIGKEGWELSIDPAEELTSAKKQQIEKLKNWLSDNMRVIKLPDLLIEVDNDLHFTDPYLPAARRNARNPDDIYNILATLMCYGCNIGPHIMPQIITGGSYSQIKHMFDWQMTDDAHRLTLALIVNGIAGIEVTKAWGEGKTAAGDGQRYGYHMRTIHRTFSHKFNDFAIELYIFVADNYALFYNLAKESTDKDTSKVLDAHLYNVSDLDPDEWFFDQGAYAIINFTAFAMLGKSFCPRIKSIKDQWLYKINQKKDYGNLNKLFKGARHIVPTSPIVDQWDRMGHFYASLEAGHVTASTALKRLTGHTEKNHFYKANLYFGRILKTEYILKWMVDPLMRKRTRKGLLKTEQVHQLARDITYGNRGRFKGKSLEEINSSGNCTAIIIAAITYWQANEISRVIEEGDPKAAEVDISLLSYISPIEWSNVILYGEYKLNKDLIK